VRSDDDTVAGERRAMSPPGEPRYQSDPDSQPDSEFELGDLRFLVVGNRGRLLDARRTPVRVTGLDPDEGTFEVEIQAFEDRGARWRLSLEDVRDYQFAVGSRTAERSTMSVLAEAASRFDRPLVLEADTDATAESLGKVASERAAASDWLAGEGVESIDPIRNIADRDGDPVCARLLHAYLDRLDLRPMDTAFSEAFVSNPNAGELIKGHAIVLAELGLCPYTGKVVRSPRLFAGEWSKGRRARHIITRLAFTQALWGRAVPAAVPLYRGMASEHMLDLGRTGSFVSATFSFDVALEHFQGAATTRSAAILRQPVPVGRLFMTFLETPAMCRRFQESEAILIGDRANPLF